MDIKNLTIVVTCVILLPVSHPADLPPALEKFREEAIPIMQKIISQNTLHLGDDCNIGLEWIRKGLEKRLLADMNLLYLRPQAHGQITDEMAKILYEMTAPKIENAQFCDTFQNLECAATWWGKAKCACAIESESVGFKAFFKEEHKTCVLRQGSMCAPQEMVDDASQNSLFGPLPLTKITCTEGTTCIVKRTGLECTTEALKHEFDRLSASHDGTSTKTAYAIAKAMEGICICSGMTVGYSFLLLITSVLISLGVKWTSF